MKMPLINGTLLYTYPLSGGKLYQCSKYEIPQVLRNCNIDTLILAAREYQPKVVQEKLKNVNVRYIPLDDGPYLSDEDKNRVDRVAALAVSTIKKGRNVLSTCHLGLNRSGLISAVILKNLTIASSDEIVKFIRNYRSPKALGNRYFVSLLQNIN